MIRGQGLFFFPFSWVLGFVFGWVGIVDKVGWLKACYFGLILSYPGAAPSIVSAARAVPPPPPVP